MKRAILTQGMSTTLRCAGLIAALLMVISQVSIAQVDCNVIMACNDGIQVSLDDQCEATITADMMLEDMEYSESDYTVSLFDEEGNPIPGDMVDGSNVGMTIQVSVSLNGCDNSCWGNIVVEDKLPPLVDCQDVTVGCNDSTEPSALVPFPVVDEPCGGPVDIDYYDEIEILSCADAFAKVITRNFTVTDNQGNSTSCTQMISVERAELADVTFPPNYDGDELPMITCGTPFPTTEEGAPSPDFTGFPTNIDCPNIQFYYTDVLFDVCGAGQKVLRTWVVIDWCTGQEATDMQIIKVIDNNPPVCTAQPDFADVIPTDPEECIATYIVPPPIVIFECSDWDYEVAYKLRDENGNPFDNPITDNVVRLPSGLYQISGLPVDTSWIVYTLTDACGNSSMCFTEVVVTDQEAPNAICEGYSTVSLDDNGSAKVFATSIDDNSFDNCSDVTLEVRRLEDTCGDFPEDLEFGEFVHLCCEDVPNSPIQVVLRVTDEDGNVNECIANVNVQDKFPPVITCPPTVDLVCGQDYTDMSLTGGMATADDNCGVEVEFLGYNTNGLNDCGVGFVFKNFSVTDPQGRTATCSQRVNINNPNPFSEDDVEFPADITVSSCMMNSLDPANTGLPEISNDQCASIAISYTDQTFQQEDDLCLKVLRTWRILDECSDDISSNNFITQVQKIGVTNTVAPEFTQSCSNQSVTPADGECTAQVDLSVSATDDCTDDNALVYSYTIDYGSDGSVEVSNPGNDASGVFPAGTHEVVFTVMDQCGNERSCTSVISVADDENPTPICFGEVIWAVDENGEAVIWASDFNHKSFDSCDGENLSYSFNAAGTQPSMLFTCADIPNGMAAEIPLNMYVFDQGGNSNFCEVTLILQDSELNDACTDDGSLGIIAGRIINEEQEGIATIDVDLLDIEDNDVNMQKSTTDEEGTYNFAELEYFDGYMIKPLSSGAHANGVTTLDLVLIQRHILGLQEFDNPQQLIAADINGSSAISSVDVVELRKVVLGVKEEFSNNTAWKFIPANFEFPDPEYPWTYPTALELEQLYVDEESADFYGIKIGDVNGTATNLQQAEETESRSQMTLIADDQSYLAGQTVTMDIFIGTDIAIEGMQFTIDFDADRLSYVDIVPAKASISSAHINAVHADRGKVSISYDHAAGLDLSADDLLMQVQFVAKADGQLDGYVDINSDHLQAEAYDLSHSTLGLSLELRDEYKINLQNGLVICNTPNPFTDETMILFTLAQDEMATVRILDVQGRVVLELTDSFTAGTNRVQIQRDQLIHDGVYYYQLETEAETVTQKMIMIR